MEWVDDLTKSITEEEWQGMVDDLILKGEVVTTSRVKKQLFQEKDDSGLIEYMEEIIEGMLDANEVGNALVYKNVMNSVKNYFGSNLQFSEITPRLLKQYKNKLKGKGMANSTMHLYLRTIRSTFNKAIQDGIVSIELYPFKNQLNPNGFSLAGIKLQPNHRALSEKELLALMSFDTENNENNYANILAISVLLIIILIQSPSGLP